MSELAMDAQPSRSNAHPGEQLRQAREALGWTVEQVAEQLKWAPRQVLALESNDYAALPGLTTARGFMRAYAKLLKLDPNPLVAHLDAQSGMVAQVLPVRRELATPFSEVRLPSMHKRGPSPAVWALAGAVLLVLAALLAAYMGWLKPLPPDLWGRMQASRAQASLPAVVASGHAVSADASSPASAMSVGTGGAEAAPVASAAAMPSANGVSTTVNASASSLNPAPLDAAAGKDTASGNNAPPAGANNPVTGPVTGPKPGPAPVATTHPATPTLVPGAAPTTTAYPPAAPATGVNASASNAQAANVAAKTSVSPANVPGNNTLVLKFRQDCWVEVKRVNGNVLLSRLLKAGETETVPMNEPVQLVVGNVNGVDASLRGAPLVLKNGPGNTARIIVK